MTDDDGGEDASRKSSLNISAGFEKTHQLHTKINIEKYIIQLFKVQYLEKA